ncbi:MAG: hypothetical protein GXO63_00735 [Candidatus Micrarchaeota archaeon]|nr:hypothetical protein [Candidatus Micrarchaeota archaeon]
MQNLDNLLKNLPEWLRERLKELVKGDEERLEELKMYIEFNQGLMNARAAQIIRGGGQPLNLPRLFADKTVAMYFIAAILGDKRLEEYVDRYIQKLMELEELPDVEEKREKIRGYIKIKEEFIRGYDYAFTPTRAGENLFERLRENPPVSGPYCFVPRKLPSLLSGSCNRKYNT